MPEDNGQNADPISKDVVDELLKSQPWVFVIAVALFITAGVGLAVGLYSASSGVLPEDQGAATPTSSAIVAVFSAFLYTVPGYFLLQWSRSISDVRTQQSSAALLKVLQQQTKFWRVVGTMIVAVFVIGGLMMLFSL